MFKIIYSEFLYKLNKNIFLNHAHDMYEYIKELIILELIANYKEGVFFDVKEIQNAFSNFFDEIKQDFPSEYFNFNPSTPNKNKLRTTLINLTISNIYNQTGLGNRPEIEVNIDILHVKKISIKRELISYFYQNKPTISSMLNFHLKYPYIYKFSILSNSKYSQTKLHSSYCNICSNSVGQFQIFNMDSNFDKPESFLPSNIKFICEKCLNKLIIEEILNNVHSKQK